jgi:hypothetical protein
MATNKHLDVRIMGRDSVINRVDDDLKNLSLTIMEASGNLFVFLPGQQYHMNRVNMFYKYALYLRVCFLLSLDFYLLCIQTNRLINISRLINLALESRDSNVNQIYNPKQRTLFL